MTPAENHFREYGRRKKWRVIRPSWPDFLCLDQNGELFAVEVKQGRDRPSANQTRTFDMLTLHGDMGIYLWKREAPTVLWTWEQARAIYDE